jgi:signal transduction histidine kinase
MLHEEAVEGMDRGLGLFSVRERLEALGGSVEIASAPSRGRGLRLEK